MSDPTDAQYRARTQAINRRARALEDRNDIARIQANALRDIADEMRTANMLVAAGFESNTLHIAPDWAKVLTNTAIDRIGVKL